jgi:type VI secretion system protein ImpM
LDVFVIGAFGKLPTTGDFVRSGTGAPLTAELEQFLHAGVDAFHQEACSPEVFDAGRTYGFLLRPADPRSPETLVGLLAPSRDAVGRRFPFVVFDDIEQRQIFAAHGHLLPLAAGDFLEQALRLSSRPGLSSQELPRELSMVRPTERRLDLFVREYADWAVTTRLSSVWSAIFGDVHSPYAAAALIGIAASVEPWRGTPHPPTSLSVRLPLGGGGTAAVVLWLDIVRRLSGWHDTIPTAFWHWSGNDGDILIQLGDTPASSFVELYRPDPDAELVYDLVPRGRPPTALPPPAFFRRAADVIRRPEAPVAELLDALAAR